VRYKRRRPHNGRGKNGRTLAHSLRRGKEEKRADKKLQTSCLKRFTGAALLTDYPLCTVEKIRSPTKLKNKKGPF
jgi:hypothetical protein